MKKDYIEPEFTVVRFDTEDIMLTTVSGGITDTNYPVDDDDEF